MRSQKTTHCQVRWIDRGLTNTSDQIRVSPKDWERRAKSCSFPATARVGRRKKGKKKKKRGRGIPRGVGEPGSRPSGDCILGGKGCWLASEEGACCRNARGTAAAGRKDKVPTGQRNKSPREESEGAKQSRRPGVGGPSQRPPSPVRGRRRLGSPTLQPLSGPSRPPRLRRAQLFPPRRGPSAGRPGRVCVRTGPLRDHRRRAHPKRRPFFPSACVIPRPSTSRPAGVRFDRSKNHLPPTHTHT